ncbi:inositol monophosphatase family protein [Labrys sp. KB_33_2]|jgi:histidinol phosphatase-like enzyme (inositol monophosphatase family)|uniref:inositol monophosphatase family protein n=1 Tax=unclassified Labrys (in: a-proteobacteria) TaxID=2688601 RepID=UPI003EBE451D
MQRPDLEAFAAFADSLADASGAIIREALANQREFLTKDDASPVTEIDRRVEARLREQIARHYPGHGILGEEFESADLDAEWVWVIDPIDGTKAFITGIPTFGTLVALAYRGVPVLGVIDNPVTHERWIGADGVPSTLNGRPIRTRACTELNNAILANGNPEPFDTAEQAAFQDLRGQTRWCVYGGGCHAYGRVADGALDISTDGGLDAFDYCALAPIIRNAGGAISTWQGEELTIRSGRQAIAASATPALHVQVLACLSTQTPSLRASR